MKKISVVFALSICLVLTAWANEKNGKCEKDAKPKFAKATKQIDGELVYRANCTRCHNTPPTLTERQTKAVVSHMRVRGSIPADQADAVLNYLSETARKN
jgi:cytochrome c553